MEPGAIDCLTQAYVQPVKAEKGREYKCADCNEKVVFRKGSVRKPHFAHMNTSNCQYFEHPNESQQHKDAKLKLAEWLKQQFKIQINNSCPKCTIHPAVYDDEEYKYDVGDSVVIEYRDPKHKYVADIAVLNNNKVKAIFEIKHTHETTTNVRPEPWYEITTDNIFEEEERLLNTDESKDDYYPLSLWCVRKSRNRYCINCSVVFEKWAQNIPILTKRNGQETMWKQEAPCIICGAHKYSPQFINGPRQLCKICLATDYQKLKEIFDTPLFIDD
jgi:hypothetical protein